MPSRRKKKSKAAKGRKPAAGKGGTKGAENVTVNEQKQGTLDSKMQRLKIGDKQACNEDDALLEEAIKLAAVEEQEMKAKEKENCTHGYNPSSISQARFCEDVLKAFTESYHASTREGGNSRSDGLNSAYGAFRTALTTSISTTTSVSRVRSRAACVHPFCLAEGTKFILDGKSDDARLPALLALFIKRVSACELPDNQKMIEVLDGDEHTLVQFFRKQIPCSCLDKKYKEVKSITKMGICSNGDSCPLPGHMEVRSKMLKCTGCQNISYCSRECQEAHWPHHKLICGKTAQEIVAEHASFLASMR